MSEFTAEFTAGFSYPLAGSEAQPEVRLAVERFRRLPVAHGSARVEVPLLYWLIGSGTPPYKMSKPDSAYGSPQAPAQSCGNCVFAYRHVVSQSFICSQIAGPIRPQDWCRLWRPG